MIKALGLTKRYHGAVRVLDELSMHVPPGSVYGLVGQNGSGKTTLLRHIMGILRQDSGEMLVDGQPVWENVELKGRMAYIPDDVFYFYSASVNDMKNYYRHIYSSFDMNRYNKMRELFPEINEKKRIRNMSRGMQKQAALWLQLCLMPDIIVLDEVADGLDPVARRLIWKVLIADVAERGLTVLVSSHNLRELEDVCDHIGIMSRGKVVTERPLDEVRKNICKIVTALPDGKTLPDHLDIIDLQRTGKLLILVLRGSAEENRSKLLACNPLLLEASSLTLEELFIYEMGGRTDASVQNIL